MDDILNVSRYALRFFAQCRENNTPILNELPEGWKFNPRATTAPVGYMWAWNGKSLFSNEYRHAVIKIK